MTDRQKVLVTSISAIVTFCLLYEMVAIFIYNDFLNSLIPGWHKTLYRLNGALRDTVLIGISAIITYLLFKIIHRALTYVWLKIFPLNK